MVQLGKKKVYNELVEELPFNWVAENFEYREPGFFKILMESHPGDIRAVPVSDSRNESTANFRLPPMFSVSPVVRYMQAGQPVCVICSLASALHASGDTLEAERVYSWLEESIAMPFAGGKKRKIGNKVCNDRFDHVVDKIRRRPRKYDPFRRGNLAEYKPPYHKDVILCLLVDSDGGKSHAVSLWDGWIFDSNIGYAIPFLQESLDWCCSGDDVKCEFCCFGTTIRLVLKKDTKKSQKFGKGRPN